VSEKTKAESQKIRRDYEVSKMIFIVESYLEALKLKHPPIRSNKFTEVAYSKVACEEILARLKASGDLPFNMTVLDILEQFVERNKRFTSEHPNKQHSDCFMEAAFLGEYFIEQYWFNGLGDN